VTDENQRTAGNDRKAVPVSGVPGTASLVPVVLATFLPLLAFAMILLLLRNRPRASAAVSIAAVSISFACALFLLLRHRHMERPIEFGVRWLVSGDLHLPFGYLLDPVSLLMITVVAGICLLVQIYSLGYMAGDAGFARYYGFMSLFAWAMTSLAVSLTLLQLYLFWELVGLASYLLIGFWYEKSSAAEAGKKAFVMTRLGDVFFFLGILLVLIHCGDLHILQLNGPMPVRRMAPAVVTAAALLIFGGIVGKSAQFPLLTWLPDAMEGPTPVSALLHSATMVAAGVYLFARLFPFFSGSPTAMGVILAVGTLSMAAASTMALVSRDIKRIWAYSTISQLGYMIMGLAAGGYVAGVFHLTTHAAFKALLFLCAGVFIHHFGTNDIFEIGRRGARGLKIPLVCTIIGAAALSSLPPLSGFFSKELIMGALADLPNPLWVALGLVGVFLTAYYSFRLVFVLLFPQSDAGSAPAPPVQSVPPAHRRMELIMVVPLILLAVASLCLGFVEEPLDHFLRSGPALEYLNPAGHRLWVLTVSLLLEAMALGLSWWEFGRKGAPQVGVVERIAPLQRFFGERWYLDRLYRLLLDRVVYRGASAGCAFGDRQVIDGGIDGLSRGTVGAGRWIALLHTATVQYRLLLVFVATALMGLILLL
jgi:NADH-quinone oxidoreductase subunit L